MGFIEAVRTCLRKYVTFSGRARRPEYWWFWLACLLAGIVASTLDAALFGVDMQTVEVTRTLSDGSVVHESARAVDSAGPLGTVVALATFLPLLAANWRRLHDSGRSGWWTLLPLFGIGVAIFGGLIAVLVGAALYPPAPGPGGVSPAFPSALMAAASLAMLAIFAGSWLLVTVFLLMPSEPGENRFGPEPAR